MAQVNREGMVIRTRGLTKVFGEQAAVDNVTFDVPRGLIFGYVGPSGSGKTTTIKLLLGLLSPSRGEVAVLGYPPILFDRRIKARMGYMPQSFVLYPGLTVKQNLLFAGRIYGMGRGTRARANELLELVELNGHERKLAGNISGGMQRRLSLAATLLHDPELIFFDEPTAGVDPVLRRKFWDEFHTLKAQGRTLFVTTQYVSEVENCDLVGVMMEGELIALDSPLGLRRRAYGGDVIALQIGERVTPELLDRLETLVFAQGPATVAGPGRVRMAVDDAATAIPELIEWGRDQNLTILSVEQSSPGFDDVFVELIRKEKALKSSEAEEVVKSQEVI